MVQIVLTSAQQSFVDGLKMQNTDDRAVRVIEAAFALRNSTAASSMTPVVEARNEFTRVIDEVAG